MKKYILFISLFAAMQSKAQAPDDALKASWFTGNGTARNIATGGVMGSLGGDLTSANVNPAGLGMYKTSEFVLSPGFLMNNNKLNYRGKDTSSSKSVFNYGATGFVFGTPNRSRYNNGWKSSAFSISVNQLASYNNKISYRGFNNQSSFSEQYLEELAKDGADTLSALSNYIFGSSLAFRTYYIDTIRAANGSVAGFQSLVPLNTGINQEYNAITRGGYHEIAIGYAGNMEDKLYIGGSLTIPIMTYEKDLTFIETDATSNANNNFARMEYKESVRTSAVGVGVKLGFIYKPQPSWRLGFAIHTPQLMAVTDRIRSSMKTQTEGYAGFTEESSDNLNSGRAGQRKYNLVTPYRLIGSLSYVFSEDKDVTRQRGFLSGDIEFVNYRGARFSSQDVEDYDRVDYLDRVNDGVKDYYKGNVNIRLGGELKFNTFMVRLGGAFYGSPYADENISGNKLLLTTGIGYRNYGFFVDLSYSHALNKDANFPYRLNDVANTYAVQTGSTGNAMLTLGFKF